MDQLLPFRAGHFDDASPEDPDGVLDLSNLLQHPHQQTWKVDELAQPSQWAAALGAGAVSLDNEPALYIVRVGWHDEDGHAWQRSGVIGVANPVVSTLTQPTTVVVPDSSFSELLVPEGVPLLRATASDAKHYRVWRLHRAGYIETIGDACKRLAPASEAPFVLATADFFVLPAGLLFCLADSL